MTNWTVDSPQRITVEGAGTPRAGRRGRGPRPPRRGGAPRGGPPAGTGAWTGDARELLLETALTKSLLGVGSGSGEVHS